MTRSRYISRMLTALYGNRPATPAQYHFVAAMADRAATVFQFDAEKCTRKCT